MCKNSEGDSFDLDNESDVELKNNNEEKKDSDSHKKITELTDDEIRCLVFESEAAAYDFYTQEGEREKKYLSQPDRCKEPRPLTRTKCKARLRVTCDIESKKWRVSDFISSHNHELIPPKYVHLIPNYRRMSEADKALVDGLHSYGVRTCHILGFMMSQTGGHEGLGFCRKDLYNYIDCRDRARVEGGDAFAALSYLQAKADNDHMFFSKFTITEDGSLDNLFWADGISRIDFECFGDVVAFDTTYKKNRYNKPLVVFCGYNHHGETTIFGSALISNEKNETYEWVLNAFSKAMFGKHPTAVITDGDKAMRKAIRVVFPNASHRLCSWHLNENAVENVKNPHFLNHFKNLIYATYTPERFESEWKTLIDDCGLSEHKWVKKVYAMKKMWAGAYMREKNFCGMTTTSLCEGTNSFIKRYVHNNNSLVDLMHNFEKVLKEYRHNEIMSDFKSLYSEPVLTTALQEIEHAASKVFTRKKFWQFKKEIEGVVALNVGEQSVNGDNVTLKINK